MKRKVKIPKSAVKPMVECCSELSEKTGKSTDEVFKDYLRLIDKYAEFFDVAWPETTVFQLGYSDEEWEFIQTGKNQQERLERFTCFCLRRNISLEGFDAEGFKGTFDSYGGQRCIHCAVPNAMKLREDVELLLRRKREVEEDMKGEEPSWLSKREFEHNKKPEVVRRDKMWLAKLEFFEEFGGAKGKSCTVRNEYLCPFGELYYQLAFKGLLADELWKTVEWYDRHWNCTGYNRHAKLGKWFHCDEPEVMDVTSSEDIIKAIEDGRFEKILEEHEKYEKEKGSWY